MPFNPSTEAACGHGIIENKLALEKAGIPVMLYDMSPADPRYFDEARVIEQATAFFESLGMTKMELPKDAS